MNKEIVNHGTVYRTEKSQDATIMTATTDRHTVTATVVKMVASDVWGATIEVDGAKFAYVMGYETRGRNAAEFMVKKSLAGVVKYISRRQKLAAKRAEKRAANKEAY